MATHNELGTRGESWAEEFLSNKGYAILEKNYRFHFGEVDLIAKHEDLIVFVEVKTRGVGPLQNPLDTVNAKKRAKLIEVANHYLEENEIDAESRFDIILIETENNKKSIRHIEDAFNSIH